MFPLLDGGEVLLLVFVLLPRAGESSCVSLPEKELTVSPVCDGESRPRHVEE